MTKNEFIEKYIDIPEESCDYIPLKKEMESDLNTLIETLLTEYQALQLQQTGVMRSNCINESPEPRVNINKFDENDYYDGKFLK